MNSKLCHVCGDVASAYNHNGLTCQSCKMFFRRNVSHILKFKCAQFDEKCPINRNTRKSCSKCRMNKCLAIGMKKELIGKLTRKIDINNNDLQNSELLIGNQIQNSLLENHKITWSKNGSKCNPRKQQSYQIELNSNEQKLIKEIQNAMNIFDDEYQLHLIGEVQTIAQAFNLHAHYARRIVKFCKNINSFCIISQADQLTILKGFYYEIVSIRLAYNFDPQNDSFLLIGNETGDHALRINLGMFNSPKFPQILSLNRAYKTMLNRAMDNDPTIRDLIITHFLFKPRKDSISLEFINYEYRKYTRLLQRYLEHKYGDVSRAVDKYTTMMNILEKIYLFRKSLLEMICDEIDTNQVEQILKEVFEI